MENVTLVLDGDCGLCNRLALFLVPRLEKESEIRFLTNQSNEGREIISNEKSYIRSAAAIRCLLLMKWHYKIFYPFCWIVPLPFRDIVYMIISRNRHKIFTKPDVCTIPSLNNDLN